MPSFKPKSNKKIKFNKKTSITLDTKHKEFLNEFTKDESIVLKDLHGTHSFELDRDVIKKHFIHSYCRTCHSFQGSSIDEKITIFDWKFFFVNRKWIYTAVTRATELKKRFLLCRTQRGTRRNSPRQVPCKEGRKLQKTRPPTQQTLDRKLRHPCLAQGPVRKGLSRLR